MIQQRSKDQAVSNAQDVAVGSVAAARGSLDTESSDITEISEDDFRAVQCYYNL